MKRVLILILIASLAAAVLLAGNKKEEALMTALQDSNPQSKFDKLVAYQTQYGEKEDSLSKLLYINLVKTALQLKMYEKAAEFGEKALTLKGVDPNDGFSLEVRNNLWKAYFGAKEMQKAYDSAQRVIDIAKISVDPNAKALLIAPALNLQVAVIDARSESDVAVKKEALQKALEALQTDRANPQYMVNVLVLGDKVKKLGDTDAALAAFDQAMQIKPGIDLANRLAVMWEQKGDKEKAVSYLKAAYGFKKSARSAYYIAALIQKNNVDDAMAFLAEAFLLNDQDFSIKAVKFLRHLFFNVKNTPLDPKTPTDQLKAQAELLDAQYTALLDAARVRLGMDDDQYKTIMDTNHDLLFGLTPDAATAATTPH